MIKRWEEFNNLNERIDIFGIKRKEELSVLKWVFDTDNQINDFKEIKKKLEENGISTKIEMGEKYPANPYYGSGWVGWYINKFIRVKFDLTRSYTDDVTYSPLGEEKMAMRESEKIPKLNGRFDVNRITNAILNFAGKKKIFDKELKDSDNAKHAKHSDIDPYGEENWNTKRDEIEKAEREEDEFWGWMDVHKND